MTKNFTAIKTSLLMGMLLVSVFTALSVTSSSSTAEAADLGIDPFITFSSTLEVNTQGITNQTSLEIDKVYSIPVTVTYSTNVPASLVGGMAGRIFVYGSIVVFPPQLQLEVVEENSTVGDWALLAFDSPTVIPPSIPVEGDDPVVIKANLMISPRVEAPAEPQTIEVRASIGGIGKIQGKADTATILFTPSYIPEIDVFVSKPTRIAGPREPVEFEVEIVNNANKVTIVKAEAINVPSSWAPIINPTSIRVQPNGRETVTFSVIPPYDFGWHDDTQSMELKFTPYPYPIPADYNSDLGQAESAYLRVNNYGFAITAFELGMIAIIVIVAFAVIYMYNNNKKK